MPRPIWWLILNLIVLSTRPQKSGHAYAQVWNQERNEAPLITITRAQAEKLAGAARRRRRSSSTGRCATASRRSATRLEGAARMPAATASSLRRSIRNTAAATTATANDAAFAALATMRWQPAIRTLPPYHDDPVYIDALAERLLARPRRARLRAGDGARLLPRPAAGVSRQGRPLSLPMPEDDAAAARAAAAGRRSGSASSSSRASARAEWLQPYTDVTIAELAKGGAKRLAVIMPGFSADCLETLEEIAIRAAETFRENGGDALRRDPLPQRQRGGHAADRAARPARAGGLGVNAASHARSEFRLDARRLATSLPGDRASAAPIAPTRAKSAYIRRDRPSRAGQGEGEKRCISASIGSSSRSSS